MDHCLTIRHTNTGSILEAFSDSDFAGEPITARSCIGYTVKVFGNTIGQKSTLAKLTALSTTEAELIAVTETMKEMIFMRRILTKMGHNIQAPKIYCDNLGTIEIAKHPAQHQRTKHYNVKLFFVREKLRDKEFELTYVESKDNEADIHTKPLAKKPFEENREKISIAERTSTKKGELC